MIQKEILGRVKKNLEKKDIKTSNFLINKVLNAYWEEVGKALLSGDCVKSKILTLEIKVIKRNLWDLKKNIVHPERKYYSLKVTAMPSFKEKMKKKPLAQ